MNSLKMAEGIQDEMASHLIEFFTKLQEDLDRLSPGTYKVEDSGHVVIFEDKDDVRNLSDIGLNHEDQGILGCIPEWFETIELDGIKYYRFLVLYNDSFGVIFYSAIGIFEYEVEEWMAARLKECNEIEA